MIVEVNEHIDYTDDDPFFRKRHYCFFCHEHTSSYPELVRLKEELNRIIGNSRAESIYMDGVHDYEGNCAWDSLLITMTTGTTIKFSEGYNGMDELRNYNMFTKKNQYTVTADLLNWVLNQIDNHLEYLGDDD